MQQRLPERQKSVLIVTYKDPRVGQWDPMSIAKGIAGAEEAVIYLSLALAKIGFRVVVVGDPPVISPYTLPTANPLYISSLDETDESFDAAILWRMIANVSELKTKANKVYFWPHDLCMSPVPDSAIEGIDDVLWLSSWQRKQWISQCPLFAKFTTIFGNGVDPCQFDPVVERKNPYSCIYGSNYARGLQVLLEIWPQVKSEFPKACLDIYYGWKHWGLLSKEKEEVMRSSLLALRSLDVIDHGCVNHFELSAAYQAASFWTYPCILPETFCISALRAQLGGAVPVIIEGTALSESSRHGYRCQNKEEYLPLLLQALRNAENITVSERKKMGEFILQAFTWEKLAQKFQRLLS